MKVQKYMINLSLASAVLILSQHVCSAQQSDMLSVMFWNLENFYDNRDDGAGESDKEFSSSGTRRWTRRRFTAKCNTISKSIYHISDRYGRMPDFIGLAEVENERVLKRLIYDTALKKAGYSYIHFEGKDPRGIDVAALYLESSMKPESITRKTPVYQGDTLLTRDILHIRMNVMGDIFDFIVNHHPSKYGGSESSQGRREAAMTAMKHLCDSLMASGSKKIVAMGDFNDNPDADSFSIIDSILSNKAEELYKRGEGTIRYEGRWDMIDMFLVSPGMDKDTMMEVVKIPFLMTKDSRHVGDKPLRTYSGPKYIGGVSDHCPVILHIY